MNKIFNYLNKFSFEKSFSLFDIFLIYVISYLLQKSYWYFILIPCYLIGIGLIKEIYKALSSLKFSDKVFLCGAIPISRLRCWIVEKIIQKECNNRDLRVEKFSISPLKKGEDSIPTITINNLKIKELNENQKD